VPRSAIAEGIRRIGEAASVDKPRMSAER
jgi:hypothetical protein